MPERKRALSLVLALGLLGGGGTAAALRSDAAALGGWKPVVTLWGGDLRGALATVDKVTQALGVAIHKHEIDEATQRFIDGVLDELHDFDLDGLYKLLPEERNGKRQLHVKGALSRGRYVVARAEPGSPYAVSIEGPRSNLADFSLFVEAEQKERRSHDTLIVGGSAGLGIGPLSYRSAVDAQRELLRMVTTGSADAGASDVLPPSGLARAAVREMNPGLGAEDVDALAVLFDAFPAVARALVELGRVEDVRAADTGKNYFHMTVRARGEPERLEKKYPALARQARRLDDLVTAKLRLLDDRGRDLGWLSVDSEKLQGTLEFYVRDGLLLPFDDHTVYADEPFDPMAQGPRRFRIVGNARFDMLGLILKLKDIRADAQYEAHDSYVSAQASFNHVPWIQVEGRALGMFSAGFLDLFIPSNVQEITETFFQVLADGNAGKGAHGAGSLGAKAAGAPGTISGTASAEIMDTFLIKVAGGLVAKRLVPDEDVKNDALQLAADLHDAFRKDLASFKGSVRP